VRTTCEDISIGFDDSGQGPPVVLVHGMGEDRSSWAEQAVALHRQRRVVVPDVRGHGATSVGEPAGALDQLGNDLAGLLESVTGPADCVGFSLGGTIVLWVAANRPDLVNRVIVLGTSSVVGRSVAQRYRNRVALFESGDRTAVEQAIRADTAAAVFRDDVDVDRLTAARLRAIGDGRGYCNAAAAMAGMHDMPLTPALPHIGQHVDVVGAEHDALCPRKASDILVNAIPDATYHEVAGAGHLVKVDQPDSVTALLHKLLGEEGTS
jgi:pimeloyl-ACP methyl ester carboxylesterase